MLTFAAKSEKSIELRAQPGSGHACLELRSGSDKCWPSHGHHGLVTNQDVAEEAKITGQGELESEH